MADIKILQQGAEAKIILSKDFIIKDRIKKSYRIKELDDKIRKSRTRSEAKLLKKASEIINTPKPFFTPDFYQIKMPFIQGKKLSEDLDYFPLEKQREICKKIGAGIAKLHEKDIIHGDLTTSNMILIEKENKVPKGELSELKKLNLSNKEYAVFGSAPLAIRGIRESHDIDIVVKKELWEKLEGEYPQEKEGLIKIGKIEIYKGWLPWIKDTDRLIDDADIFEGIRFVKLKYVVEWKKAFGREKDLVDLKLIEEYQKRGNISFSIFFIDFGLGFISRKFEDKAVDLHLLKQALEARHFKQWETLFNEVLSGYKEYKDSAKVLERLKAVEKRGRYKEH